MHFPRYCRGGIAVCISGLTSGKPRLTSLKTPVLPRFFAVKNTAVKNRTRWCLNSLLFPLFQRLMNFNRRDVARRWFDDVIDFTWLLLLPWFTNRDFWALLPNANVSRRKKWKLVPFATARRNKTDIIEIELLRYIPSDVHWKGQISPVMQIWCAFELKLTPRYIPYFLQILLHLALSLSFNMSFIYYFNYHRRIKSAKDLERFDLFPHRSHNLFWDSQYANSNSVQCSVN